MTWVLPWVWSACQIYGYLREFTVWPYLDMQRHTFLVVGFGRICLIWWLLSLIGQSQISQIEIIGALLCPLSFLVLNAWAWLNWNES